MPSSMFPRLPQCLPLLRNHLEYQPVSDPDPFSDQEDRVYSDLEDTCTNSTFLVMPSVKFIPKRDTCFTYHKTDRHRECFQLAQE